MYYLVLHLRKAGHFKFLDLLVLSLLVSLKYIFKRQKIWFKPLEFVRSMLIHDYALRH